MRKSPLIATISAAVLTLFMFGCSSAPEVHQLSGSVWGTTYHITYTSSSNLSDSILLQMEIIDSTLSMFREGSEVSRINAATSPLPVSATFLDVFRISKHVNELSHGAFDPTVAPLVDLWGFGRKGDDTPEPDSAAIAAALTRVGIDECSVSSAGILHKKHPLSEFDFSAVAKGYGVDCIAAALSRAHVNDYMVEVGGEIALAGNNPRGELWHIQIDAPVTSDTLTHQRLTLLTLTDCCIATSGNYRRWRDTPEGRVGHTISPHSGRPVATNTLSVTVIAPTCAMADALATACMAMHPDSALTMIDALSNTSAMLVLAADSAAKAPYVIRFSNNWPAE